MPLGLFVYLLWGPLFHGMKLLLPRLIKVLLSLPSDRRCLFRMLVDSPCFMLARVFKRANWRWFGFPRWRPFHALDLVYLVRHHAEPHVVVLDFRDWTGAPSQWSLLFSFLLVFWALAIFLITIKHLLACNRLILSSLSLLSSLHSHLSKRFYCSSAWRQCT